jgi:hypothetical protein
MVRELLVVAPAPEAGAWAHLEALPSPFPVRVLAEDSVVPVKHDTCAPLGALQ